MQSTLKTPNEADHQESLRLFISLRDHITQRFADLQRATELAEVERSKAAQIVRESVKQQIEERDKSAVVLKDHLRELMKMGDDRLHEHVEQQIHQIRESLTSAEKLEISRIEANAAESRMNFAAAKEAIGKADAATEKRFEGVNEFRAQLADQAGLFMPRKEAEQTIKGNAEKSDAGIKAANDKLAELTLQLNTITSSLTTVAANSAMLVELKARMDRNDVKSAANEGKDDGKTAMWGYIVGGIGLAATLVAIVIGIASMKPKVDQMDYMRSIGISNKEDYYRRNNEPAPSNPVANPPANSPSR